MSLTPNSVPSPWTPLEISTSQNEVTVGVQGRSYTFGDLAALPTRIETCGENILAAPVRIVATSSDNAVEWKSPHVELLQSDDAQAIVTGAVEGAGFYVGNSVQVGFDGAIRFDTTITPMMLEWRPDRVEQGENLQNLSALWLEIPLRAEYASLFTWWPLDYGGAVAGTEVNNSGAVPENGMALPFKPFIWLGWQDGGLSWFCESAQGWQPRDKNSALEVRREGETVTLRLRLLDGVPESWRGHTDGWYHPSAPLTFSWGLQATPVKPLEENALKYRMVHFNHYESMPSSRIELEKYENTEQTVLDRAIEAGANVVVLHEQWNSIQNYWVNPRADEIKATVAACHARGVKILPYFGYELSTLAPEWARFHERVLCKNADGRFRGGWERLPPQRDYMVCYASEWQDKWLAGIEWMMDEYGFDGVYLDGTSTPFACANAHHGCGYQQNGERHETYPIWEVTRMFARLYDLVSARDGIITTHQSSCCVTPTLAYSHTYWDGEHIGGLKPDEDDAFPCATFQAEFMGRPFGIQAEFLSGQPEAPAYALIHNVLVRPGVGGTLDFVAPIWKAMGEFGTDKATWLPYWENQSFVCAEAPHFRISAYLREDKVLLAIANLSAAENEVAAIRVSSRDGADYSRARNAVNGESVEMADNQISVQCSPMGWRLIELVT